MQKRNLFTQIEETHLSSNSFDLSHEVKMSSKFGLIYPVMWEECIPGDKHYISCYGLNRLAPLVAPVMQRFDIFFHTFFVPFRLLWEGYERYMTGGDDGIPVEPPIYPFIRFGSDLANGGLEDYLGMPTGSGIVGQTEDVSAMPFAAYQFIYNEYYRDQNLINKVAHVKLVDGNNTAFSGDLTTMRRRAWEHDYFTSCLPTAQKGQPVNIPLGSQRVVLEDGNFNMQLIKKAADHIGDDTIHPLWKTGTNELATDIGVPSVLDPNSTFVTEDSGEATTIADFRRAFKLQEFLEKSMRGGTRYSEFNLSMYGVRSPDARLQRPEYVTGSKTPFMISEVLNTTGTDDAPQGTMSGHGVAISDGYGGSYYCQEHGIIMTLMSIIPKTSYQQGIPKKFIKINDRYETYFKQFEGVGEQAVERREVYAWQGETGKQPFGYIPRYSEYKFANSRVSGDFRSSLDFWHDGRIFSSAPSLNQQFIECTPDTRIFAVEDGTDYVWQHIHVKHKATRKMAYYGTPHF